MRKVTRRAGVLCLVLSTLGTSACGDEQVSAVGSWALRTVNGDNLPAVLSDDGTTQLSIRRALLWIRVDDCIVDATYITTTNGTPHEEDVPIVCDWEQSGGQVGISWPGGGMSGPLTDTFLTLTDDDGHEYSYERL